MRLLRVIACLALTLTACYEPSFQEGLPCSEVGECPDGYTCAVDNKCYLPENVGAPADAGVVEPEPADADVDAEPTVTQLEAITDLTTEAVTTSSIRLSWTAPEDGDPTGYDLRYSTAMITEASWASAMKVNGEPMPGIPGTGESFIVTGLIANTTYYFAIKTSKGAANTSELSNVTSGTTNVPPPPTYVGNFVSRKQSDQGNVVDFDYTVPAGPNRLLIVLATADADGNCPPVAPATVRYGGLSLTRLEQATNGTSAHASLWYLIGPVEGEARVVATWSCTGGDVAATALSYAGVDQTSPFGAPAANVGTGSTATVAVPSGQGELVVDGAMFRFDASSPLPDPGAAQVPRVIVEAPEYDAGLEWTRTLASDAPGSAAGVTMTWTTPISRYWAIVGVSLKPAL